MISKRVIDIVMAVIGLFVLFPLFLIICAFIKFSSNGPVIFRQKRIGKDNKMFLMFKFRTMHNDSDEERTKILHLNHREGPIFKMKNDPRVTKIGRFLRESSLDELPQLVNVLKGEMSFVGPRPLPAYDIEHCTNKQKKRLDVLPGITGIWQISGRSMIPFRRWMAMDLYYVKNKSLLLDIYIMLKTVPAVVTGIGAW